MASPNLFEFRRTLVRKVFPPRALFGWVMVGLIAVSGCGGGSDTTDVQGKISYKGTQVTSGVINFQPSHGHPLGGGIQPDGSYSFALPPGEYRVRIDAPPPAPAGYKEGDPLPKLQPRFVPEKYADYNSSGLTLTVTGDAGPQTVDFMLP